MRAPRAALALALAVLLSVVGCGSGEGDGDGNGGTPGPEGPSLNTGPAPWPVPSDAKARIEAAGLPALPREQLTYHIHAHLDIFVDGTSQPVPAQLGIDTGEGVISPLHTHDDSGIIHVESATQATFTLGQLFTEWGVRLDDRCAGGYCAPDRPTKVFVNGNERQGDPRSVPFSADREQIAMVIGTPPPQVPSQYDWARAG